LKPLYYALLCIFLHHVAYSGARFAIALYALQLHASPAVIGVLIALFSLVPMVGSVPVGRWIDRRGSRGLLITCCLLILAGTTIAALFNSIALLFLVSILVGGGFYPSYIATQQLVGRYGRAEDRAANFSTLSTAVAISGVTAPLMAGFGVEHLDFTWTFLSFALLPLISLAIYLSGKVTEMGPRTDPLKADEATGSLRELLGNGDVRRVFMMGILITTSWDTFLFITPIYCSMLLIPASKIGIILAAYSTATLIIRIFAGRLSRSFTPWQLLIASITCLGVANFAFGFAATVPLLILFAFGMGLSQGVAGPMINTILYEAAPPGRVSEAMGLRVTITKGYQIGLPLLTGTLGTLIGVAPLFWLVSTALLGGSFAVRGKWRAPRHPAETVAAK
jgi:MFS family permease